MMETPRPTQLILEVTEVKLVELESYPSRRQVIITGLVPCAGWASPRLMAYIYAQPPTDGIYEFDFIAVPPQSTAERKITPIQLTVELPQDINHVRIYALSNDRDATLNPVDTYDTALSLFAY
jgi:hypothetical protein